MPIDPKAYKADLENQLAALKKEQEHRVDQINNLKKTHETHLNECVNEVNKIGFRILHLQGSLEACNILEGSVSDPVPEVVIVPAQ